jgi:membrane protease YdiL (CAAX protease family)
MLISRYWLGAIVGASAGALAIASLHRVGLAPAYVLAFATLAMAGCYAWADNKHIDAPEHYLYRALSGALLGGVCFAVLLLLFYAFYSIKVVHTGTVNVAWGLVLCSALAPAIAEEVLLRGYLQRFLTGTLELCLVVVIIIQAVIFVIAHALDKGISYGAFVAAFAVLLTIMAWRSKGLLMGIGCHGAWNLLTVGFFGATQQSSFNYSGVVHVPKAAPEVFLLMTCVLISIAAFIHWGGPVRRLLPTSSALRTGDARTDNVVTGVLK